MNPLFKKGLFLHVSFVNIANTFTIRRKNLQNYVHKLKSKSSLRLTIFVSITGQLEEDDQHQDEQELQLLEEEEDQQHKKKTRTRASIENSQICQSQRSMNRSFHCSSYQ
jgi:hypothetical protein